MKIHDQKWQRIHDKSLILVEFVFFTRHFCYCGVCVCVCSVNSIS